MFGVERNGSITINPGNEMVIDAEDVLFYICLTGEENAQIIQNDLSLSPDAKVNGDVINKNGESALIFSRENSINSTCSLNPHHSEFNHSLM